MKSIKSLLPHRRKPSSTPTAGLVHAMAQCILPAELIGSIIDEVGRKNDITTLKQCALVSQEFVYQAQKFLFHTIDLDRRLPRKKYYQRFQRLLSARPQLGEYVRELKIGDGGEEDLGGGNGDESWISNTKTLPETLRLLPRLEIFSLSFNSDLTAWKTLPLPLRNAIAYIFRLESLQSVALEFITAFPPQLLMGLGRIRNLSLSCVEVDSQAPLITDKEHMAQWKMRLQSLFLRGTSPATIQVLKTALSATSAPPLRRLTLTPTFENGFAEAAGELILQSGTDLARFEWLPSIHFAASSGTINLALLPKLRHVRFAVSFRKSHANGPFSEILRLLSALAPSDTDADASTARRSPVETLTLDIHCVRVLDRIGAQWRPLDHMLARPAFDGLKELRVRMCANTTSAMERGYFAEAFGDLLPCVQERGATRIVLEVLDSIPVWCQKS